MDGVPAIRDGKRLALALAFASLSCFFTRGSSAQEFTAAQPHPPDSHRGLACASSPEQVRLRTLLKSWQAAYADWEGAIAKMESAKPAYDEAQARFDEALAHERSFAAQLLGTMRGSWSPELFAASARRDDAYAALRATAEKAERAFGVLQAARSADEQLSGEISKRSCARPRAQSQVSAEAQPQAQPEAQPAQAPAQPQPCRQLIISEAIRCR
ncbi:MAG TPA: hypothetical protein VH684_16370 [Xanthobacteraceae bacterium]|jgi:hypothetical protein